ncbi:hypothetical protein [Compostibacter hankyongensis]|uniref:Lipoprotein n=1 Tax=Compostibacter hankyongensis TaxID=1007089 RepID=A0ABP8FQF2_9BACT
MKTYATLILLAAIAIGAVSCSKSGDDAPAKKKTTVTLENKGDIDFSNSVIVAYRGKTAAEIEEDTTHKSFMLGALAQGETSETITIDSGYKSIVIGFVYANELLGHQYVCQITELSGDIDCNPYVLKAGENKLVFDTAATYQIISSSPLETGGQTNDAAGLSADGSVNIQAGKSASAAAILHAVTPDMNR